MPPGVPWLVFGNTEEYRFPLVVLNSRQSTSVIAWGSSTGGGGVTPLFDSVVWVVPSLESVALGVVTWLLPVLLVLCDTNNCSSNDLTSPNSHTFNILWFCMVNSVAPIHATLCPVGGIPNNGPTCLPVNRNRQNALLCSTTILWISQWYSSNAFRMVMTIRAKPSCPTRSNPIERECVRETDPIWIRIKYIKENQWKHPTKVCVS